MNRVTEQLWNYIDGTCTPEEREAISILIAQDEVYKREYEELLALNTEFSTFELEEPPMAFTYNVMEAIRAEEKVVPLKATINKQIIRGIAALFVLSITALVIFALASVKWTSGSGISISVPADFKLPSINFKSYLNGGILQGFLFIDLIFGMFLFDAYLRKRNHARHV